MLAIGPPHSGRAFARLFAGEQLRVRYHVVFEVIDGPEPLLHETRWSKDDSISRSLLTEFKRAEEPGRYHFGGSDPRYVEMEIISSSERFETAFFISSTAVPALDPF